MKDDPLFSKLAAFVLVSGGGVLMGVGPYVAGTNLYLPAISVGALSSLCGIILLFRLRFVTPIERRQAAERLAEDLSSTTCKIAVDAGKRDVSIRLEGVSLVADQVPSESCDSTEAMLAATDVAALTSAIGKKERFHPPPGPDYSTSETGFYCFGNLVAAETPSSTHKR
jgi:hypothetical protein